MSAAAMRFAGCGWPSGLRRLARLAWLALLAGCADPTSGLALLAAACPVDRLAVMPLENRNNLLFLSATIDDQPVRMLLDTGADRTVLTEAAVERLSLARDPSKRSRMQGIGQSVVSHDAKTHHIVIGTAMFTQQDFAVGRFARDLITGVTVDGLLGVDILAPFDVEIDPVGQQAVLYRPRPCPEAKPPWTGPYLTLSGAGAPRGRMQLPIVLDGVSDMAILDTGAQVTTISERLALRTGVSAAALGADPAGIATGASPDPVQSRAHRFRELRIGPSVFRAPVLAVLPLPAGQPEALVGADYLSGHRIWLSFASRRVFLEEAGPPRVAQGR